MRVHVTNCAACKSHYRRRQILAELDPEALPAEERHRLADLGSVKPERRVLAFPAAALAIVAIAAVLFFVIRPAPEKGDGFHARGAGGDSGTMSNPTTSTIAVYRVGDHTLLSANGFVRRDDELAFSYTNGAHKPYVMIFGVDERGEVYWFYPAWTSAADNPKALATDREHATVELKEAIKHPLAGERLTIHGLFLDEPRTVRDVEAALHEHHLDGMPGAVDMASMFEVGP